MWGLGKDVGINVFANLVANAITAVLAVLFAYWLGLFPGQDQVAGGSILAFVIAALFSAIGIVAFMVNSSRLARENFMTTMRWRKPLTSLGIVIPG